MTAQTLTARCGRALLGAALVQLALLAPVAAQPATLANVTIHFGPDQTPDLTDNSLRRTRIIETRFLGLEDSTPGFSARHRVEFRADADLDQIIGGPESLVADYHGDVVLEFDVLNATTPYTINVITAEKATLTTDNDGLFQGQGGTATASISGVTVSFLQPGFLGGYQLGNGATRGPTSSSGSTAVSAGVGNGFFGDPSRTHYAVRFQWDARCESRVPQQVGNGVSCQARAGFGGGAAGDDEMQFGVAIVDDDPPSPTPSSTRTSTSTHTPLPTSTATATQTPTFTPTATPALAQIGIADASAVEGNSGTRTMAFRISVKGAHPDPIFIQFDTSNGTAQAGSDYTAVSGAVTLPLLADSVVINVPVLGDTLREHDETFSVNLRSAIGATIVRAQATGTIVDDDVVGVPELLVPALSTNPGEIVPLTLRWTHPERWRDLATVDLRLVDDAGVAFWGRFTEGADHFSVCDDGVCDGDFAPGAGDPVDKGEARFHPAESAVHGTGPTGPSVDLTFAVSLDRGTAGRELRVEVAATDDDGAERSFAPVGSVAVAGSGTGADDDACQVGPADNRRGLWLLLAAALLRAAAVVRRRRSGAR